jgi:poly(A) polymerase
MSDLAATRIDPPPFRSDPDLAAVLDALPEARIVGGAVRDALVNRAISDIDLATPLPPEQIVAALNRAAIRAVPTGLDHGTVTAVAGGRGFEITTLRRDVATDGRHAVVAFTNNWREDAERRDFTLNALSMTRDGAIFDYFGGIADLRAGRLRFVGNPAARIAEDYLRILRFFRFYARYATAEPDLLTREALRAGVGGLAGLSVERVWGELSKILAAADPRRSVRLMAELGVLGAVLPEAVDTAGLERVVGACGPVEPIVRLAALLNGDAQIGDAQALAMRLKISVAERARLIALRAAPLPPPDADDAALRRLLADNEPGIALGAVWARGDGSAEAAHLCARIAAMPRPVFPLEGRDVLALGVPAGREVGRLLGAIRAWWLASGCTASAAACRQELAGQTRTGRQVEFLPKNNANTAHQESC